MLPIVVCAAAVAALLLATRPRAAGPRGAGRGAAPAEAAAKLAASSAFVWAALAWGASASGYGQILLAGLLLCWLGDALLLPAGQSLWFQLGIAAFLLGHVAYTAAFLQLPVSGAAVAGAAVLLAATCVGVLRWLLPHVPGGFRGPVLAYVAVISVMVAVAAGAAHGAGRPAVLVGALAFAVSDISVARDRFVAPGFANRAWGLPLYFGAQLLLASTLLTAW